MKVGDCVRIIGLPQSLPPDGNVDGLNSTALLQQCVGRIFPIVDFNELGFAELHVGEVRGEAPFMHSIWLEPDFLVVVSGTSR